MNHLPRLEQFHVQDHVQFRVQDVHLPKPSDVLLALHHDEMVEGEIVDMSDSGNRRDAFAVVEVKGIDRPLVVPVLALQPARPPAPSFPLNP